MRDEIETIDDVLEARLEGDREEVLEAVIDPSELEAYGISNEELLSAVGRNNRLIAAGSVDTGRQVFDKNTRGYRSVKMSFLYLESNIRRCDYVG